MKHSDLFFFFQECGQTKTIHFKTLVHQSYRVEHTPNVLM